MKGSSFVNAQDTVESINSVHDDSFSHMSSVDGLSGALLGVLALFSGFCSEMVVMATVAPIYAYWMVR